METKRIPPIVALSACAISCIVSIVQGVSFGTFTVRLVVSALIFLTLGTIIKIVLDWAFAPDAEIPEDMELKETDEAGESSEEEESDEESSEQE